MIGIDLGTTYSVVGIAQDENVTIISDSSGRYLVPSMVSFTSHGVLVGHAARAYQTVNPHHTIFNAKRFIGRSFDEVSTAVDPHEYEFKWGPVKTGSQEELSGVCFQVHLDQVSSTPPGFSCVTPEQIGAFIVRHLREMALQFVGHSQLHSAVIAVPVDFNAQQRKATSRAFELAGLRVVRVLEEPTAAAIAYGLHRRPHVEFVLVYDFGGGTLDVSLLYVRSGAVTVIDTLGDNKLGGEDLDMRLAAHLVDQMEQRFGAGAVESDHEEQGADDQEQLQQQDFPCTRTGLRRAAEWMKRELSTHTSAQTQCEYRGGAHAAQTVQLAMTRSELEALCAEELHRTLVPVKEILRLNHMTVEDIDEVVLVGGSSRIPWIQQQLTALFHGRPPQTSIDPDVAVAFGAARALD